MTTWEAIQNSIDSGTEYGPVVLSPEELDELEQLADGYRPSAGGTVYTGATPDGDTWAVLVSAP